MFVRVFLLLCFFCVTLGNSGLAQTSKLASLKRPLESNLSKSELQTVLKGKFVTHSEDVQGHPWPIISVFGWTDASTEEIFAVFYDYNSAKTFVPNIIKSQITKKHSPTKVEIDYCIDVPILADENYTSINTLHPKQQNGRIQVTWSLVRADNLKKAEGLFTAVPWKNGAKDGSLILYSNLTDPGSVGAGLLKGFAYGQMRDCVRAILDKVANEKKRNPRELQAKVDDLNKILGGR
ncbi:MAG: hypothetical protein ACK5LK_01220 [Chthoniobacterales bacterium]